MARFQVFVSYSQISVFDPSLSKPFNNWTPEHVAQGFAWRNGSVSFATLLESDIYDVEILLTGGDVPILPDAIRAIEVPFLIPSSGLIEIASISDSRQLELAPGPYELRFEALPGAKMRFVFMKDNEARFSILRADSRLKRVSPLLRTAESA